MAADLPQWKPRPRPERKILEGRYARLEPLDPAKHGDELFAISAGEGAEARFRYLFEPPPASRAALQPWLDAMRTSSDPMFWTVIDKATGKAGGRQALMRIDPNHGVIEIGNILWGAPISRSRVATEALYLFAAYAFDELGYRRFEWKCNDDNVPSKRAAIRFGFSHEGLFRQHMVVKGKNRDTAWFSMIDTEWPALNAAYAQWLSPDNFDWAGRQSTGLHELIAAQRAQSGPQLRRATPADRAVVEMLQQSAYANNAVLLGVTPIPLQADYGQIMHDGEVWLTDDAEGATGAIILIPQADHLELWSVAVAPRAQGRGLGNVLVAAAEKRARDLGYRTVRLLTGEKLTDNVAWYQRHGYTIDRTEALPDRRVVHFSKWIG